jgi:hypothetical protein
LEASPDAADRTHSQPSGDGAPELDEEKLEAFAEAYVQVARIKQRYGAELQNIVNEDQAVQLQNQAATEMTQAIEAQAGISIHEFQEIQAATQVDPALRSRVTNLVEEVGGDQKEE